MLSILIEILTSQGEKNHQFQYTNTGEPQRSTLQLHTEYSTST